MNQRVLKKPQVERDLVDHFSFIAQDKLGPAERFLQTADETFKFLADNPLIGQEWDSPLPELAGIRVFSMPKAFRNYLIFYRPVRDGAEILTILHGSRDLAAIVDRLMSDE
jgi:toxin ParE1/3/4